MDTDMKLIAMDYMGYMVYENSEGFLEGFKSTGKIKSQLTNNNGEVIITNKANTERVVTVTTNLDDFGKFIKGRGKQKKSYAPANVEQTKLFSDEREK